MVIFSVSNVLFSLLTVLWRYLFNWKLLTLSYNPENQTVAQKSKTSSCFLGFNVRCLSYHLDEFKVLLASLDQKPDVIALTEKWMTVDDDTSVYKLEGYQPIEASPRKEAKRRSDGVAFYIRNDFHYTPVEIVSDIECSIIKVNYNDKDSKLFCVIYRPDTYKPFQFLQQFENLLLFLKSLKYESLLFGDFNIDTLIDETNKNRYETF